MKRLIPIILTILSVSFLSCSVNEDEMAYDYDGNIYFTVSFDSATAYDDYQGFRLYMMSEETFSCFNYEIKFIDNYSDGDLALHILDVMLEGPCATALGPVRKKVPIQTGSEEFDLYFYNAGDRDRYHVILSGDSAVVTADDTSFTRFYPPAAFPR
ncbi:MAG: hypothetical protein ACE5D8_02280 [Fidelibacterota bacterium]